MRNTKYNMSRPGGISCNSNSIYYYTIAITQEGLLEEDKCMLVEVAMLHTGSSTRTEFWTSPFPKKSASNSCADC